MKPEKYLSEEDYDKLTDNRQKDYWYCRHCGQYRRWKDVSICPCRGYRR